MSKRGFIVLVIISSTLLLRAQYVTLPDSNFVRYLNALGDSACLNGDQLDTTCPAILNMVILNCGGNPFNIRNIEGIQYFKHLDTLVCSGDFFESLPVLPPHLRVLECQQSNLFHLSPLPLTLKVLSCDNNSLTTLPMLPDSLSLLTCSSNQLTSLPSLPPSLLNLICWGNNLSVLPDLPDSLGTLDCSYNSNLFCFPRINKINLLRFNFTSIACLPDYGEVAMSSPSLGTLPLCDSVNPYDCEFFSAGITALKGIKLSVFPNPTTNKLEIEIRNPSSNLLQITVTDVSGQRLSQQNINPAVKNELDVSELGAGMYFVVLQGDNEKMVRKFVKE